MNRIVLLCLLVSTTSFLFTGCGATSASSDAAGDKAALLELQHRLLDRFKAHDLDGIMSCYLQDESLLVFDVVIPRQYLGAKAYRKDWADLLEMLPGPIEAEAIEPFAEADHDMGYGHMVVHYIMTDKQGKKVDLSARFTDVYKKINGKWLVVHEHTSWPVDFATGKADLQSKP